MLKADNSIALSDIETQWLNSISSRYKLPAVDFQLLLKRVDVIPPSLALAQAAIESGWGTSRFAMLANALYGQWTWSDNDAAGLTPLGREAGEKHRIKSFSYLIQSVEAYALNLNSHSAYADFRLARAQAHAEGQQISGKNLAPSLLAYSTRREAYVKDLENIIRINQLSTLDEARLQP